MMSLLYADGGTPSVFFIIRKEKAHEIFFKSVFQSVLSIVGDILRVRMSFDVSPLESASCAKFF